MNDNLELLELMYSYLKNKKNSDTFKNIWNNIASKSNMTVYGISKENVIAELYTDLVLDNRFVLTSEGMWGLREFLKYDEIKKQYDCTDHFETIEEFKDIDLNNDNNKNDSVETKVDDYLIDNDYYIDNNNKT